MTRTRSSRSEAARLAAASAAALLTVACSSGDDSRPGQGPGTEVGATTETLSALDLTGAPNGLVPLDDTVDPVFTDLFARYGAIDVGGARVHILAQAGIPTEKILRARAILALTMEDLADSGREGSSKSDVAAEMANRGAILALVTDEAAAQSTAPEMAAFLGDFEGTAAVLPATRVVLEGSPEYLAAMPAPDHAFGAAAALVHRTGIDGARADEASELEAITAAAVSAGVFTPPADLPVDLEPAAYLALAMDVHAGVFGHDPDGDGIARAGGASATFIDRGTLRSVDPLLGEWIDQWFTEHHGYQVVLPEAFTGNFDGLRRWAKPYTARSQHLRWVELSGTNSGEIFAAPFDSVCVGNVGNNNIKGRAGDDEIDGGAGFDTAVFSGPRSNYVITYQGPTIIVEDVHGGHDGTDTLTGINRLQFTDGGFNL